MDNLNSISYDKNWKKASNPVRYKKSENISVLKHEKPKVKKSGKPLLTIIQIIICLIIVMSVYLIKLFSIDLYKNIKEIYQSEINNEIILNPYENSPDKLINAFKD